MSIGYFGRGLYGLSYYGGAIPTLAVVQAVAPNANTVEVEFSAPLDVGFAPLLDVANYSIPGLMITGVAFNSSTSVILTTDTQAYALYTVTVAQARSATGLSLNALARSAPFTGHAENGGFLAVGTARRRVRVVFADPMQNNAAIADPGSYTLTGPDGTVLPINGVTVEQPGNVLSVVLLLGTDLITTEWYQIRVSGAVITLGNLGLIPNKRVFQWVQEDNFVQIGLDQFTGEVQGGLFGNPLGLVFFSPALEVPIANSVIEVDEVDVCTTAYDTYSPPTPVDPFPLYTWAPGGPQTGLGQTGVALWAPFPRLVEATFSLELKGSGYSDTFPTPYSGAATITVAEAWDKNFVALLNNTYWGLGPTTTTSALFITASNLAPIPPGPSTTMVVVDP